MSYHRLIEIDAMRGLAIMFVVTIHTFWLYDYAPILWFGVPMFVFISGLVLTYKYKEKMDIFRFYKNRILFIGIPYLFWSAIMMLVYFPDTLSRPIDATFAYYLKTSTGNWQTLWFVYLIFQFYMLFPFLIELYKRSSCKQHCLFVFGGFFLTFISFVVWNNLLVGLNTNLLPWSYYFILGMTIGYHWNGVFEFLNRIKRFLLPVCLLFGMYIVLSPSLSKIPLWFNYSYSYSTLFVLTGSSLMILFILFLFVNTKRWLGVFRFLGSLSFGIFLIHRTVMAFLSQLPYQVFFIIVSLVSICLVWLLQKLPYSEYIIGKK